jgi:dCMP deaminase
MSNLGGNMMSNCAVCGCIIHRAGEYAEPSIKGRSHATKHHYLAERFLGRSRNRRGEQREPIFKECPWDIKGQTEEFCYECHEELLHNPVLLQADVRRFAELVRLRNLNETTKTKSRDKIAGRIKLLHEVLELGIEKLLGIETHSETSEIIGLEKWDKRFVELAKFVSEWSKDPNTKVGAVITNEDGAIALGYNGFPKGIVDNGRLKRSKQKLQIIIHAEENAILQAGDRARGSTLYVWGKPICDKCARIIIQKRVSRVVSIDPGEEDEASKWYEPGIAAVNLLKEAKVKLKHYKIRDLVNNEEKGAAMGTPKRSPIERASIKGIGDLRRKNQLSRGGQKGIGKRVSRRARDLK